MGNLNDVPVFRQATQTRVLDNTPAGSTDLFRIVGAIRLIEFAGFVALTAMEAQQTRLKITGQCDALGVTDLCAVKDATGWTAGTTAHITGIAADVLDEHATGVGTNGTQPMLITPCASAVVSLNNADGVNAGQTQWFITWEPMSAGASVTALI
jgi:hypothetical protein